MADPRSNSSTIYAHIIANSLFTPRQLSIISKKLQRGGRTENISSGAIIDRSSNAGRVTSILYTMLLLQSTGIVELEALATISKLAEHLVVIFASERSRDATTINVDDVICDR